VNIIELPAPSPDAPLLTRVVTEPVFSDHGDDPITWMIGSPSPLAPQQTSIVRMFLQEEGVDIYCTAKEATKAGERTIGIRVFVPFRIVRVVEEAMALPVLVDELDKAEQAHTEGDEDEDESDDETGTPKDPHQAPVSQVHASQSAPAKEASDTDQTPAGSQDQSQETTTDQSTPVS
jgi:hypothetical protein